MDPNACLQAQDAILDKHYAYRLMPQAERERLRDLRTALWAWLDGGGFAPDWHLAPFASVHYGKAPRPTLPR